MPNESLGGISVSISVGLQDLQAQFEQAQQMADAAGKAMASAFNNASGGAAGGINEVSKALEGFNVSALATGFALNQVGNAISGFSDGVFQLGARALETAGKFEQWTVSFTTLLHSEEAAKSMLADLVDFAIRTPFEIPDVVNNAQKLMAFGFAAQEVIPMLTTLGDAVAGLGKGASSLNSLTLAFGEMESKGVIQLRQLNMLTLQGIPAIEALAKAYDVSISEMSSMITKKLIPASEGIPILLAAINDRFGGLMEKQSQTFLGMLSNLSDAATKTFRAIGDTMLSSAKQFEEFGFAFLTEVQQLAEAFGRLPTPVQDAAIALGVLAAAAGPVVLILGNLAIAVGAIGAAMPVLAPIAGVIAGIGAELALIHFSGLDSEVKQFASDLVDSFDRVKFSLQEVAGIARDEAGSAFDSLSGSLSDLAAMARPILGVLEAIIPDLKELETTAGAAFEQIRSGKANVDLLKGAFDSFFPILSGIVLAIHNARIEMQVWVELFEVATGRFKSMSDAAKDIQTQLDKNSKVTSEFKDEMNRLAEAMKPVSKGTLDVVDSQAKLETAYEQAQKTYAEMKKLFNEHLVGASEVARAYDAMKVAFAAAHPELKSVGGEIDLTTGKLGGHAAAVSKSSEAQKNWNDVISASLGLGPKNTEVVSSLAGAFKYLGDQVAAADELWKHYIVDAGQALSIMDKGTGVVGGFTVSMENGVEMIKGSKEAIQSTSGTVLDFTSAEGQATSTADKFTSALGSQSTSLDHLSKSAKSAFSEMGTSIGNAGVAINKTNGSLSQFVSDTQTGLHGTNNSLSQFESDTKSSMGSAQESFKATTGQVNALSVGIAFLAMQMSGLTAFSGSGGIIDQNHNAADLQHQLYLAKQMAGDPSAQPFSFTTATSGALKGQSFDSVDSLNQALADLAKNTASASASTKTLGESTATLGTSAESSSNSIRHLSESINQASNASTSFTKSADGLSGVYTTTNQQIDYASMSGQDLANVLNTLNSELLKAGVVVDTTGLSAAEAAQKLQDTVDGMNASSEAAKNFASAVGDTASAVNDAVKSMAASTGELGFGGNKLGTSYTIDGKQVDSNDPRLDSLKGLFDNYGQLKPGPSGSFAPGGLTDFGDLTGSGAQSGQIYTSNGSPSSMAAYRDALIRSQMGIGPSGSSAITALPGSMVTSNGTSNYTPVPSNQQSGSGITVQMNYPSFNSQQQADQVVKQVVTQLRTVVGLKL